MLNYYVATFKKRNCFVYHLKYEIFKNHLFDSVFAHERTIQVVLCVNKNKCVCDSQCLRSLSVENNTHIDSLSLFWKTRTWKFSLISYMCIYRFVLGTSRTCVVVVPVGMFCLRLVIRIAYHYANYVIEYSKQQMCGIFVDCLV